MTRNQLTYWNNQEVKRANQAKEQQARNELVETNRHNKTVEAETHRDNVAKEAISGVKTGLDFITNAATAASKVLPLVL